MSIHSKRRDWLHAEARKNEVANTLLTSQDELYGPLFCFKYRIRLYVIFIFQVVALQPIVKQLIFCKINLSYQHCVILYSSNHHHF